MSHDRNHPCERRVLQPWHIRVQSPKVLYLRLLKFGKKISIKLNCSTIYKKFLKIKQLRSNSDSLKIIIVIATLLDT